MREPSSYAGRRADHISYDPDFFAKLAEVEQRHFWFRGRNRLIAGLLRQLTVGWADGYRVLEVGCGTGNVLEALEKACTGGVIVGTDLYEEGLAFARKRTQCALVQADLERPAFRVSFDVVGAFDVVEHLPDDAKIFRLLGAMLKPNGILLITVPAYRSLWSYFDEVAHHCRRYETSDLRERLTEAGLQVEFLSPFMASIFPLIWLVRRTRSGRTKRSTRSGMKSDMELTLEEMRIVPGVNELLNLVLMFEAKLIQWRVKLPFGSSLIAVARRKATC